MIKKRKINIFYDVTLQFENGYAKRSSPPNSPSTVNPNEDPLQTRMGQKVTMQGMTKRVNTCLDWEPNRERSTRMKSPVHGLSGEIKDVRDLIKVRRRNFLLVPLLLCSLSTIYTLENFSKKTFNPYLI